MLSRSASSKFKPMSFMVVSAGGDLPPPPTGPILDPVIQTLSVTSSPGPMAVAPSGLVVPQIDDSSSKSSLATPVVSDFDHIPDLSIVLITEPLAVNTNLKGWKNVLVGNTEAVDPNIVPIYSQTEEALELPDIALDCILQNMANTLVGMFDVEDFLHLRIGPKGLV